MFYEENRKRARTINTEPTLTDQAAARETDINVIVGRMLKTGTVPGAAGEPIYADWTQFPVGLRDMIHLARDMDTHRDKLPKELKDLTVEELIGLTAEQLTAKLTPPAPAPEPKKEEPK